MAVFDIVFEGFDALKSFFNRVPEQAALEQRKVLYKHALMMFAESQLQVPYENGDLQRSGVVEASVGRIPEVLIGYGGNAAPYALVQHENLDYNHATEKNGFDTKRKAKYLEDPVLAGIPNMKRELETRMAAVLGKTR
jgi:hypothetical protein